MELSLLFLGPSLRHWLDDVIPHSTFHAGLWLKRSAEGILARFRLFGLCEGFIGWAIELIDHYGICTSTVQVYRYVLRGTGELSFYRYRRADLIPHPSHLFPLMSAGTDTGNGDGIGNGNGI